MLEILVIIHKPLHKRPDRTSVLVMQQALSVLLLSSSIWLLLLLFMINYSLRLLPSVQLVLDSDDVIVIIRCPSVIKGLLIETKWMPCTQHESKDTPLADSFLTRGLLIAFRASST